MKKLFCIIAVGFLFLSSCSKENSETETPCCWKFTIETTWHYVEHASSKSSTSISYETHCDLIESQAEAKRIELSIVPSPGSMGYYTKWVMKQMVE